jgi:uncharacterized protein YegP (UPF0339 family)
MAKVPQTVEKTKARKKYTIRFFEGKGKHKFRWHVVAANGRIVCSSEGFLHKHGPKKTVFNLIDAVRLGQFTIEDYSENN